METCPDLVDPYQVRATGQEGFSDVPRTDPAPAPPVATVTRSVRVLVMLTLSVGLLQALEKQPPQRLRHWLRVLPDYSAGETILASFLRDNPLCRDKEPLLQVIAAAGVSLTTDLCRTLPSWENVTKLYGKGPIIEGLDSCNTYRDLIQTRGAKPRPKIAGLWNTGTTALSKSFNINMELYSDNESIAFPTVTWGKHTVLRYKYNVTWPRGNKEDRDLILPVVIVRDPYRWMQSMCTAHYGASWPVIDHRCPNLIPTPKEIAAKPELGATFIVDHKNYQAGYRFHTPYESLAQMYSSWYSDYFNASFPRIFIREEDMLFHPEQVMRAIGNCSGMPIRTPFHYLVEQGKPESHTELISAMIKYGSPAGRIPDSLTEEEKKYLQTALDPKLMHIFHYHQVDFD